MNTSLPEPRTAVSCPYRRYRVVAPAAGEQVVAVAAEQQIVAADSIDVSLPAPPSIVSAALDGRVPPTAMTDGETKAPVMISLALVPVKVAISLILQVSVARASARFFFCGLWNRVRRT
jgi:hypothetical protein